MIDVAGILAASLITQAEAVALLAAYPGVGELLAATAAQRFATSHSVNTRPFIAADIVTNWSGTLDHVMVGLVLYETTGMTAFGSTSVCIDKRSRQLVVGGW